MTAAVRHAPTLPTPQPQPRRNVRSPLGELTMEERRLLTPEEELDIGFGLRRDLGRLDRLVRLHPDGCRAIARKLGQVCRKEIQVYAWFHLKETYEKDLARAVRLLERWEDETWRSTASNAEVQTLLEAMRASLVRYALDPEMLTAFANQVVGDPLAAARQNLRPHSRFAVFSPPAAAADRRSAKLRRMVGTLVRRVEDFRDQLVLANQKLVAKEALRYETGGLEVSDLYQEGILGLSKAAYRYEAERGLRFSTYATYWVRQAVRRAIVDRSRVIRVPQTVQTQLNRAESEGGLTESEATRVRRILNQTTLFSQAGDDSSAVERAAVAETSGEMSELSSLESSVRQATDTLSDRERLVLAHRFGLAGATRLTLERIGEKLSISRERVRQIEQECLSKLRQLRGLHDVFELLLDRARSTASFSS